MHGLYCPGCATVENHGQRARLYAMASAQHNRWPATARRAELQLVRAFHYAYAMQAARHAHPQATLRCSVCFQDRPAGLRCSSGASAYCQGQD